ncbi:NADH:ubiquinone oxidoreductase subunit 6 (subunit J) [Natronocella acetinitrilica]|uniref:NADH:ubiquinone oxidoreductase subunit 6 (Subunit J) n=1 Tax=Natronocella acetinitrilica TaxID=414046 RepID=A0AAE3G219_9GAMM|nr:hypothetical protein [Natronocella acetinitrilica]MCP1674250.1 NADH:ubiquinone oxidoreductase subunit 6 (subunit J) [Natronocella acetinitrilica]
MPRHSFAAWRLLVAVGLLGLAPLAQANDGVGFVATQFAAIAQLIVIVGYLVGFVLFGIGIYGFKRWGENPNSFPLSRAVMSCIAATLLLTLGATYDIVMRSTIDPGFSGSDSRHALALSADALRIDSSSNSIFSEYLPEHTIAVILGFIFVVGLYNFVKGIYLLKNIGASQQQQEGTIAKPLTHIIGGILAMNINVFSCILANIIGFSGICIG